MIFASKKAKTIKNVLNKNVLATGTPTAGIFIYNYYHCVTIVTIEKAKTDLNMRWKISRCIRCPCITIFTNRMVKTDMYNWPDIATALALRILRLG